MAPPTSKWKPGDYHDEYREALMDFIERKIRKGDTVSDVRNPSDEEDKDDGKVLDLAEYLQRSMKKAPAAAQKAPAKKTAAKKAAKTTRKHAAKSTAKKARQRAS